MNDALLKLYERLVLRRPLACLIISLLVIGAVSIFAKNFRLDASADSLVLKNDQALKYYRSISARYGSDDYLVISYSPHDDLFAPKTLADLTQLCNSLQKIARVKKVNSILDVPLIDSPRQKKTHVIIT